MTLARLRLGYADPPYINCAHLYRGQPDYAGEVDHAVLVRHLDATYDGWVLHTAATPASIAVLAPLVEATGARWMAWVKGFTAFRRNVPGRLRVGAGHHQGGASSRRQPSSGHEGLGSGEHYAPSGIDRREARGRVSLGLRNARCPSGRSVARHAHTGGFLMRGAAVCRRRVLAVARFGLALTLTLTPGSGHAQDIDALVRDAASQAAIPPSWIRAVLRIESDGDRHAVSSAGAMGLMQIMPGTWRDLRHTLNLGADPFDPHDNIVAGAAYLRWLHDRYGDAGFLAAYNAGPGRYDDHLATGRPLPDETQTYVASVMRRIGDDTAPALLGPLPGISSPIAIGGLFAGPAHPVASDTAAVGDSLAPPTPAGLFVAAEWREEP
ncbi:hypothetical protein KMAL_28660 [Novacetimonas maltaceti]|uniref:Transglycosylase SLT domain-containing protein n=3 Tax=Acetobacterales TaxID=3120395 RepID=A0A2S3VY17_9PROT|nr:hypothetical protein KMAL_28660 [Novacetimonas maltaceti]BAK84695.1 murein transglycosylase [Komagataeibacter medellinensis NBRC 3288]